MSVRLAISQQMEEEKAVYDSMDKYVLRQSLEIDSSKCHVSNVKDTKHSNVHNSKQVPRWT